MRISYFGAAGCIVCLVMIVSCKSDDEINMPDDSDSTHESACPYDNNDGVDAASELSLETPTEGFLCPIDDADYYKFTVTGDTPLLKVELTVGEETTSINPTYIIYSKDGADVLAQPASNESARMSSPLSLVHSIASGDHLIQIHDESKDATDNYHPYTLTLTVMEDKDGNEPNNEAEEASSIDGEEEGYISYRGDEDWYSVAVSDREILDVTLTVSENAKVPTYKIVDADGNEVVKREHENVLTEVHYMEPLSTAGTYYLVIYDEEGLTHDPDTPYTLEVSVIPDPDTNEPNDATADATPLSGSTVTCGSEWTTMTGSGYIASSGDIDWFKVDLASSAGGLVDIDVQFSNPGSLPDDFQASVRIVRAADGNSCSTDQECKHLEALSCVENVDCTKFGNSCLTNGLCAGANTCLPGGVCGANLITRSAAVLETSDPEYDPGAPVSPDAISVAAPLFGMSTVYIAVTDHKSDSIAIEHEYTLTVSVATDTDPNEPNEIYMNEPQLRDDENGPHLTAAKPVTVHDCLGANDCCESGATWVTGAISYTFDQDWFMYTEHPCPDADCLLKIHYQIDGGPADVLMSIYRGGSMWYDTVVYDPDSPISDRGDQPANNGICGDDECLYAHHDHSGYYFNIRDTIFVSDSGGDENNGTWDWSREQTYRFCIEKYQEGCAAPCHDWGEDKGGCGPPPKDDNAITGGI